MSITLSDQTPMLPKKKSTETPQVKISPTKNSRFRKSLWIDRPEAHLATLVTASTTPIHSRRRHPDAEDWAARLDATPLASTLKLSTSSSRPPPVSHPLPENYCLQSQSGLLKTWRKFTCSKLWTHWQPSWNLPWSRSKTVATSSSSITPSSNGQTTYKHNFKSCMLSPTKTSSKSNSTCRSSLRRTKSYRHKTHFYRMSLLRVNLRNSQWWISNDGVSSWKLSFKLSTCKIELLTASLGSHSKLKSAASTSPTSLSNNPKLTSSWCKEWPKNRNHYWKTTLNSSLSSPKLKATQSSTRARLTSASLSLAYYHKRCTVNTNASSRQNRRLLFCKRGSNLLTRLMWSCLLPSRNFNRLSVVVVVMALGRDSLNSRQGWSRLKRNRDRRRSWCRSPKITLNISTRLRGSSSKLLCKKTVTHKRIRCECRLNRLKASTKLWSSRMIRQQTTS